MGVIVYRGPLVCLALSLLLAACVPDAATNPPPGGAPKAAAAAPQKPPPWVGVHMRPIEFEPTAANRGASGGVLIDLVVPEAPAGIAGLREGDIVVGIGSTATRDAETFVKLLDGKAGVPLPIDIVRDGGRETLSVTPAERAQNSNALFFAQVGRRLAEEQQAARAAEAANDPQTALRRHLGAMQFALIHSEFYLPGDAGIDETLARLTALLPRLPARPATPNEALRHNTRAIAVLRDAKTDADNDRAFQAFRQALFHAPWLPDLWLNGGLVLEKAGYAEMAQDYLRRYLILAPQAADAAAVRQKMAALGVAIEDRKPWLAFAIDYQQESIRLRGQTLTITARIDSAATDDRRDRAGDVIARGTVRGRQFEGKYIVRPTNPNAIRCFSREYDVDARGEINAQGQFVLSVFNTSFYTETCAAQSKDWKVQRTYNPRRSETGS